MIEGDGIESCLFDDWFTKKVCLKDEDTNLDLDLDLDLVMAINSVAKSIISWKNKLVEKSPSGSRGRSER